MGFAETGKHSKERETQQNQCLEGAEKTVSELIPFNL